MVGKALGHYEILEPLGKGGMGEVYRARDTNLDRDVAIKVLPEDFAEDAERLARFEREAKLLASLNHSNIATIHGLEESDGVRFIAMELVEGNTLADRLAVSGRIEVEEALEIARQIAEALEAAHESGVIHRDLKPANIKITPDEKVKVLDFGLAKAFAADASPSEISPDLSHSPTMAAATRTGVILGTAAYMSPEQARGKRVDRRTDIWAFGCVLYEMLTGHKPFDGESVTDVLAAIVKEEPDLGALPASTPPMVARLVQRCLRKSPADRLQHIGDARIELADTERDGHLPAVLAPPGSRRDVVLRTIGLLAAGLVLGAALLQVLTGTGTLGAQGVRHLSTSLGEGVALAFATLNPDPVAISPDGSTIAYVGQGETGTQLYIRHLGERDGRAIPDTEDARKPFFSPDGRWVGFIAAGSSLWKVPVTGGAPQEICKIIQPDRAAWLPDGTIVVRLGAGGGLYRVSPDDCEPQALTRLDTDAGEQAHEQPSMLPDGQSLLFTVWKGGSYADSSVAALSLDTGQYHIVAEGGSHPVYVSTGHIIYGRRGDLFAAPFDLTTLRTTGTPVRVLDGAYAHAGLEVPLFALSANGVLVYVRHEPWKARPRLVWLDRQGDITPVGGEALPHSADGFRLSSDGTKLAFRTFGPFDIWTYDLTERFLNRVTLDPGWDAFPVWAEEDQRIIFSSARSGAMNLWWKSADGMGEAEELLPAGAADWRGPADWSSNGLLAYEETHRANGYDIWLLPMEGDRTPQPFATRPANERGARFSPDGRLLAYHSDESGQFEVYLEPVPQTEERIKVSRTGGDFPMWDSSGTRLLFWHLDEVWELWEARIESEPELEASGHELVLRMPEGVYVWSHETSQGFLATEAGEPPPSIGHVNVVLNFLEELERLVPKEQ